MFPESDLDSIREFERFTGGDLKESASEFFVKTPADPHTAIGKPVWRIKYDYENETIESERIEED